MFSAIVAASALLVAQADQAADELERTLAATDRASWTHRSDQQTQALVELRQLLLQDCIVKNERRMIARKGWVEDVAAAVLKTCAAQEQDFVTAMEFSFHSIEDDFDRGVAVRKFRSDLRSGTLEGVMSFLSRHRGR